MCCVAPHQGGLCSRPLFREAQLILLWQRGSFVSECNVEADILLRQRLRPGDWRLHPQVAESIWWRFSRADMVVLASEETTCCLLWFALTPPAPKKTKVRAGCHGTHVA